MKDIKRGDVPKSPALYVVFSLLFLLSSCGKLNLALEEFLLGSHSFLGIVPKFSTLISKNQRPSFIQSAYASSCAKEDVLVELYRLNLDGALEAAAIDQTTLEIDSSFEFNFKELGLSLSSKVDYAVKVTGCDLVFIAPVLSLGERQVIDSRSTFVAASMNSDTPLKLKDASRESVKYLITHLKGETIEEVKTNITSDTVVASQFNQIFGTTPVAVDIAPVVGISIPKFKLPEDQIYSFVPSVEKLDSSYVPAFEWKLDGTLVSQAPTWNYRPGKNDQGVHEISLKVGADNGSGVIDSTRPSYFKSFKVRVDNTYHPIAPALILAKTFVNTTSIVVNFDKSDCTTFAKIAITTSSSPSISNFIYTCADSNIPVTLSEGEGVKTINIFTIDDFGDISPAKSGVVTLDTTPPLLNSSSSLFLGGLIYSGFNDELISYIVSDLQLSSAPMSFQYSTNSGGSWVDIEANQSNVGSYQWNLPNVDFNTVRFRAIAKDAAGNESVLSSLSDFSIDSTAPAALNATLQKTHTNNLLIKATVANCLADQAFMLMSESALSPLSSDSEWRTCSTAAEALTYTLGSSLNGVKTLYLWAKDLAGNVSMSATRSIVYDSVVPVFALASPLNNSYVKDSNKAGVTFSGTCSKDGVINVSGSLTTTLTCVSGSFNGSLNFSSVSDGDLTLLLNQTDLAGNEASAVSISLKKDTGIPTLAITSPLAGGFANVANQSTFTLEGTCSEEGRSVVISGATNESTSCVSGVFSASLNLTALAQGAFTLTVNHSDVAGNSAPVVSRNFSKDSVVPVLTQTTFTSGSYRNTNSVTFGGACETGITVAISGADSSSVSCLAGSWTYISSSKATDGTYAYSFSQTDSAGNTTSVNASWIRDTQAPALQSVLAAEGAVYVGTSFVVVDVEATDNVSVASVRLKNAHAVTKECQSEYADDSWQSYTSGIRRYSVSIPPGDGEKKICVWAKDHVGNVSLINPTLGSLGVNMDTVKYEIGNPPQVIAFDVKNASNGTNFSFNEDVTISWTATDQEELVGNPISLWYATSSEATATWTSITANYGNIGSGQTSYTGSYTSFKAPSAGYFRVKIMVKDAAGNTSSSSEKVLNTGSWSVFAGSTDSGVGGSALSLKLRGGNNRALKFATINPTNNDAYVISHAEGIYKLDAVTGKTELFIKNGTTNLVDGGVVSSSSLIYIDELSIQFDKNGLLYIVQPLTNSMKSAVIWQINPQTKAIKKYLGEGGVYDNTATAATAHVQFGAFTFDESNSLYYLAHCSPGVTYGATGAATTGLRLMKATQNSATKLVDTISVVAGDCTRGSPVSGGNSLNNPLLGGGYPTLGGIAAWENGKKIYYFLYGSAPYKINNGVTYPSNLGVSLPYYDHETSTFYIAGLASINKAVLNLNGANGDVSTLYVNASGTGECSKDSIDRLDSCISSFSVPFKGPNGRFAFLDGIVLNADGNYAVRYVDENNKVKTYVGTSSIYGEGLNKNFLKSNIGGIYYKKSTELNQEAFPEGLYFADGSAMVMGKIGTDGIVSIVAGNQSKQSISASTGAIFNKSLSLGAPYSAGKNMSSLAFNKEGLPFLKVASVHKAIMKVEANKTVTFKTAYAATASNYFDVAETGDNPALFGLFVFGGANNLIIKDEQKLFLLGAFSSSERLGISGGEMKLFDYGSTTGVTHIMGQTNVAAALSADDSTGGNLANKTFTANCIGTVECYLQYREDQDRIYFSEGAKLRYITTPEVPASSTLKTLFTASRSIHNFIFSEDKTQVFYLSDGKLYCKDISSGKSWCNDSALGPTTGMQSIGRGPNQLTWKNANTLLVSTYYGMIYQYNLLP